MKIHAFGSSDLGNKREQNEDAFLIDRNLSLFVVCDGMGGHAAGDVASRKAVEFVRAYIQERSEILEEAGSEPGGYFKVVELAESATLATCERLHELASSDPNLAGMGTTMTLLIIVDGKAVMSHVGDSRLYLLRDQNLHQLSSDHTLVNEMIQRGAMTIEESETSPYQNVLTRSVGSVRAVEAEMLLFDLVPNDTFLLCSDGLTTYLEDDQELADFMSSSHLDTIPNKLIDIANLRGGHDNITALVVRIESDKSTDPGENETQLKTQLLSNSFLGERLSYNRLLRLVEISELKTFAKGDKVVKVGESCGGAIFVLNGSISYTHNIKGVQTLSVGDCLFVTSLSRGRKSKFDIVADDSATILQVPRLKFKRLAKRFPKFGRILYARLLSRIGNQLELISDDP